MNENDVGKVLINRLRNRENIPSALLAFVQQREKLLHMAMEMLYQ